VAFAVLYLDALEASLHGRHVPGPWAARTRGRAVVTRQAGGWSIRLSVHGLRPPGPGRFYECYAGPGNRG
jgi:hypothetical protein